MEKGKQYDQVIGFFRQFQDSEGRYTGGTNSYPTHADFKALFKAQLQTYLRHLRDKPRGHSPEVPPADKKLPFTGVPYRGLNSLTEDDTAIFFGREAETLEVLSRINNKRIVFVLGASGSGKSSLVAAGVLPRLPKKDWRIVRCVPGNDPFLNLALTLVTQLPELGVKPIDYLSAARKLADTLCQKPANLVKQLELTIPTGNVVLFIDQFEEVFTLAAANKELGATQVDTFLAAIRESSSRVKTLVTMRADFYGAALPHFEELEQQTYGLRRPSVFALYEMITRPAELAELTLDPGLAQTIVTDLGNESGALALMSYVLEALYLRAKERGDGKLTLHDYRDELHGVQGAINTLAEQAWQTLTWATAVREAALHNVFRELIAVTEEDGQLIPTRRRATLNTFSGKPDESALIDTFVKARLLVKDSHSVEVAHEAILRHWQALADWVATIKGDLALFRQYERDARTWDDRKREAPPPTHEALVFFYKALDSLGLRWVDLQEPLKSYTEPEQTRLLREIDHSGTIHTRRRDIGDRLDVIGDPRPGIGVLPDGTPQIDWLPVDGSPGPVTIKTDENELGPITIKPFYIAKYLVTNAQFNAFVSAPDGFEDERWWQGMRKYVRQAVAIPKISAANSPRDSVSWYQAVAFTRWLNHRLRGQSVGTTPALSGLADGTDPDTAGRVPTHVIGQNAEIRLPHEAEWQWAAQGGAETRQYPWSGGWQSELANTSESGLSRPTAVGMYPRGEAQCGALDMAGNLFEWCLNQKDNPTVMEVNDSDKSRVVRGGSWFNFQIFAAAAYRNDYFPFFRYGSYGFRVLLFFGVPLL